MLSWILTQFWPLGTIRVKLGQIQVKIGSERGVEIGPG